MNPFRGKRIDRQPAKSISNDFTPLRIRYRRGSRPFIESILKRILKRGMRARDRFEQIVRFNAHALPWPPRDRSLPSGRFYGGTKEVIIRRARCAPPEAEKRLCGRHPRSGKETKK